MNNLISDLVRTGAGGMRISHLQQDFIDQMNGLGCIDAPAFLHAGSLCGGCYGPMLRVTKRGDDDNT